VSHGSGPRLPARVGSGGVTRPAALYASWALDIKKNLVGLAM
jgi:hypothetical protein